MPGVTAIPVAAQPVNSASTPKPAAAPPAAAPAAPGGTSSPTTGGGVPMMPMGMGGMGAGGRGGGPGPGSGAVRRPGGRGRTDGPPPGLPAALSGKAGRKDAHGFVVRTRDQAADADVPNTVELIDEDLWRVAEKAPAVVAAEPPPRTRLRR